MSWLNCIHSNPSAVTRSVLRWPHTRRYWADSELRFPTAMIGGGTAQSVAWSQTTVCPKTPWVFDADKIIVLHLIELIKLIPSCKFQTCLIYMIDCWAATDGSSAIGGEKERTGKHHFYSLSLSPILFIPLFLSAKTSCWRHLLSSIFGFSLEVTEVCSQKASVSVESPQRASVWPGLP